MYGYMLFKRIFKINEEQFHLGMISYNNVNLRITNFWLLENTCSALLVIAL